MPARAAANEIDWPWLPRVAVTTPSTLGCDRVRRSMYTTPPRTLNAPIGVWFSCFTQTVQPARLRSLGHAYCGVAVITRYTRADACSSSSSVVRDSGFELLHGAESAPVGAPSMLAEQRIGCQRCALATAIDCTGRRAAQTFPASGRPPLSGSMGIR